MLSNAETITLGDETSTTVNMLSRLAKLTSTYIIGGSIPEIITDKKIYNTCVCFDREGKIAVKHRKQHLFDVNIPGGVTFYESDFCEQGPAQFTIFDTKVIITHN